MIVAGYVGKEAETKVTAELNGVRLDAAVTVLADMADLKCVHVGNLYYVTSRERQSVGKRRTRAPIEGGKGKARPRQTASGQDGAEAVSWRIAGFCHCQ